MAWEKELRNALKGKKVLVLGVGNEMKADDAIGKYVTDRLNGSLYCGEMPENYISKIKSAEPDIILIVDAAEFGGEAGEIIFADAGKLDSANLSTHSLSFNVMAKMLDGIDIYLLGIQPESLEFGKKMTGSAEESAKKIVWVLNSLST